MNNGQDKKRGILKMNTSTMQTTIIPYERQSDPRTNRDCGAACLSMVYRSFGKDVAQALPHERRAHRFRSPS